MTSKLFLTVLLALAALVYACSKSSSSTIDPSKLTVLESNLIGRWLFYEPPSSVVHTHGEALIFSDQIIDSLSTPTLKKRKLATENIGFCAEPNSWYMKSDSVVFACTEVKIISLKADTMKASAGSNGFTVNYTLIKSH